MKTNTWSSFPRWWVRERLPKLSGGAASGAHMAALRVYLAVALRADYDSRRASVSWSDLEDLTGLSRPMVGKGIETASTLGILDVDSSEHRHTYELVTGNVPQSEATIPFAKIPTARLTLVLRDLPTRGVHALDALKIYITLACVRPRNQWDVPISHKTIVKWTGVHPRHVRRAIDVLSNHRLIHVAMAESADVGHPYNSYLLLGFARTGESASSDSAIANALTPIAPPGNEIESVDLD